MYSVLLLLVLTVSVPVPGGQSQIVEEWRPEKLSDSVLESTLVRYYVFGMKNPEEFEKDGIPEMTEIGPFTYREKRVKQNFKRVNNTTLEYDVHWSMHFLPELTGPGLSEKTEFTTINVPFVTMAEGLSTVGLPKGFNDLLMDEVIEGGERLIRRGLNFGDSTFYGYNVSLYTTILDDVTQGQTEERYPELANGKFAFFKNKNNTVTGNYTVESTKDRPFGGILSFNGKPSLGMWPDGTKCDDVTGALDFFTFPRNVEKDTELEIFLPENCRTMKMKFVGNETFRGIPVYVFKFPLEQFQNRLEDTGESGTSCYCLNFANISDPKCLDEGLMDFSGCSKGAPLVGSFPHFLHANTRHLNNVKGLMPNKSLHESEVMIEPITGTPLYAVRRFQLNLRMHPIPVVTQFENTTERILPLAWFEHILEVPSAIFTEVKEKLEKIKMDRDIYHHEHSSVEEINDNILTAGRSAFPGSEGMEQGEESPSQPTSSNSGATATGVLPGMQNSLVFAGLLTMIIMWSRTSCCEIV